MEANVTILYGSETGTAQDVAEYIWKNAKSLGLKCSVSALDDYNIQNLGKENVMIFVVATTGQGEVPSNMKQFWKILLRKNLPLNLLENVRYGVLGLGDSSYEKYNFAAKKLNKRLLQLGAIELLPIGLADDQHDLGIDAVVTTWIEKLWNTIREIFDFSLIHHFQDTNSIIERFNITIIENNDSKQLNDLKNKDIFLYEMPFNKELKIGTIIENERTTAIDHFQDVRLIKLHSLNVNYAPGDVLYVRPKNSQEQVNKFFEILKSNNTDISPNMVIQVKENEIKLPYVLQQDLHLRAIVEQYWDLNFKPRKSTMHMLSLISENELEKEKLQEFTTPAGQEELYNYVNRPRRNILEVLADFPHTTSKLNVKLLFEIMSPIKPRAFSIASSCKYSKDEIHLLVAVVKYKTKLLEPRLGLCSNWLAKLKLNDDIIFWVQKGTFKFSYEKPMILIGPGTGVAPFRSILFERTALNHNLQDCILFFGCRSKEKDYHCKEDFNKLSNEKKLAVYCAFSRDQEHKIYVQHVIREYKQLCWKLLQNDGVIYLAGNSKNMPKSVREEFVNVSAECGKLTNEEAELYVQKLEKSSRYQTETWN